MPKLEIGAFDHFGHGDSEGDGYGCAVEGLVADGDGCGFSFPTGNGYGHGCDNGLGYAYGEGYSFVSAWEGILCPN